MKIRQNNVDYGYSPVFDRAAFTNPPKTAWPAYSWVWNVNVTKEGIIQKLNSCWENNIRTVYVLPEPIEFRPNNGGTLLENYLREPYFELYRFAAEYAQSLGMQLWLYDEGGWPSGSANGDVVLGDPTLVQKRINEQPKKLAAGETYTLPEGAIAAFTADFKRITGSYTPAADETILEYAPVICIHDNMPFPDLSHPKTAQDFLKHTHERYRACMGDLFGPDFKVVFTDEPSIARARWTVGIVEQFRERWGYDFLDYLPAIVSQADMGEAGRQARIDFFELGSEEFANNYFRAIQDWCARYDMLSGGHIGGEDETLGCIKHGYMHGLRVLRCLDIPGIDTIWRQIFPGKPVRNEKFNRTENANLFFPRYASSAANQASSHPVLSESYAIYGAGLTFDQMRYVMNFQAIRGITIFNCMNVTHDKSNHFMAGGRPSYSTTHPGSHDRAYFHEYAARLSYLCSLGTPAQDTALYMPMRDFWAANNAEAIAAEFERIGLTMEKAQGSFDIFDDDVMESCDETALDQGIIRIGFMNYRELWFPPCERVPEPTKAVLERFIAGGGKVYVVRGAFDPAIKGAEYIDDIASHVRPPVKCDPACEGIRVMKHTLSNGVMYYICNESLTTEKTSLHFDETSPAYELDEQTGCVFTAGTVCGGKTIIDAELLSGEGRVYLFTDDAIQTDEREPIRQTLFAELDSFDFRRVRSFVIGEQHYESHVIDEEARRVSPGDWQTFAGCDFSGDAIYAAAFAKPDAARMRIDLGEVRYTCELFINGESQGVRYMAPYVYDIDTAKLEAENRFELRVSNTPANQFVHTRNFDRYSPAQIGPYHATGLRFESESLESGLMNSVKLYI
ncbi:MAG: hypothetical protein E7463_00730 [Ruminococcaceae bacterium]|nr:hypothetical protein [Oscillospiraceae bacterium]